MCVVQEVAAKYMRKDRVTIDLIGKSLNKTSTTVRHLLLPVHWAERASVLVL